ncbi:MAG: hypothetical protein Q8O00_11180 [Holophaga sp.]|nr:hypothetical protein [Holophaga sp.]
MYPKKVAKPYAWKCWKKIKGVGADVLIGALERQLAVPNLGHFQRGDKVCLPDPSTWLNKGRWEDEVVAAALSAAAKLRSMAEKEEQ